MNAAELIAVLAVCVTILLCALLAAAAVAVAKTKRK